jgi:hypothetical protein
MSLRVLVFAALRVMAVYFLVQVLVLLPVALQLAPSASAGHFLPLLQLAATFLVALLLWAASGRFAALIVREVDPAKVAFSLSLGDAYAFAFVFLGLFFILSSLASALQQLYYLTAVLAQLPQDDPHRSLALFQLYGPAISLLAGITSLLGARFWSNQLLDLESRFPFRRA